MIEEKILFREEQIAAYARASGDMNPIHLDAKFAQSVGLPGVIAGELMARTFYSLKDARTPLFTNIFNLATHIAFILYFLTIFTGTNAILTIPVAASGSAARGDDRRE